MKRHATLSLISLLAAVAGHASAASRAVVVQPIQVCNDDGSACPAVNLFQAETDKIYAQLDVDVVFLPIVKVFSTTYWDIADSTEFNALCASGLGQHSDPDVVNCYFVEVLGSATSGTSWGVAKTGGNCMAINSKDAVLSTTTFPFGHVSALAHELGHCLGLPHCCDAGSNPGGCPTGLMGQFSCSAKPTTINDITPDGLGLSTLTSSEIATMLSSSLVRTVWTDLGHEKWSMQFQPTLSGSGPMLPGTVVTLAAQNTPPASLAMLVIGLSQIDAAFYGGTLVPNPDLVFTLAGTPGGNFALSAPWPSGAAGITLYHQFWFATGPNVLATNAVRSDAPNL